MFGRMPLLFHFICQLIYLWILLLNNISVFSTLRMAGQPTPYHYFARSDSLNEKTCFNPFPGKAEERRSNF
jgi:hypothetical protein